ncbi:MAG TPA: PepSY-associated TM helix domain-containing protein [Draconibacterium sp.]|nr:PepSY-associated TM helix domain-containing protein [Draconibacterium sp.]
MKLRKLFRTLHRDLGYFIVGMTVVYGLSGILLNHRYDFNPDYQIYITEFEANLPGKVNSTGQEIKNMLEWLDSDVVYKKHYINNQGMLKVFIENGEVLINPETGKGTMHYLQRRPVFFEMNKLHRATLGTLWKWTSDGMAVILIFVAITGLVLLKGKRGFGHWGWWWTIAGIVIPLIFTLLYI